MLQVSTMIKLFTYTPSLKFTLVLALGLIVQTVFAQNLTKINNSRSSLEIVREFLQVVRAGKNPDKANGFIAGKILAHQVNAENPVTVERTPQSYADHIKDFLEMCHKFDFEITELIAQDDKMCARWKQTEKHLTEIDGYKPTGYPS